MSQSTRFPENIVAFGFDGGDPLNVASQTPEITVEHIGNTFWVGFEETEMDVAPCAHKIVTTFIAGNVISALQAVYRHGASVLPCQPDTIEESNCAGIAITSATTNTEVDVIQFGTIQDPSFSFTPGDLIFLAATGGLSNIPPTEGYLVRLGRAVSGDTVLISIDSPVTL